ncbi:hypothetical protein ACHAXS_008909 [Conticribra weissflogii]
MDAAMVVMRRISADGAIFVALERWKKKVQNAHSLMGDGGWTCSSDHARILLFFGDGRPIRECYSNSMIEIERRSKDDDVFLTRHGARIDNEDPQWLKKCSHYRSDDPHLSPSGITAAKELARKFKRMQDEDGEGSCWKLTHIVSSPYIRCIETANEVALELGDVSIKVEPGIAEVNTSRNPGFLDVDGLKSSFPLIDDSYVPVVSREHLELEYSDGAAAKRSAKVARRVRELLAGSILFVGHGASCLGIAGAFGHHGYVGYTSLTHFELKEVGGEKKWTLRGFFGDVSHLSDKQTSLDSAW